MLKIILYVVLFLLAAGVASFFALGISSQSGSAPGISDGKLAACPSSPNCVSSEAGTESDKSVEVLPVEAWDSIAETVRQMGGNVTNETDAYIAAEFKSSVFGFVDDIEFRLADEGVHVRSASRVGYSDAGVNAKRVAELRSKLPD